MLMHLSKLQGVLTEFIATRVMPSAPPAVQWLLAGATPLVLGNLDKAVAGYLPMLSAVGLVSGEQIDLEKLREFFNNAFDKRERLPLGSFSFTREDSDALLEMLEKHHD